MNDRDDPAAGQSADEAAPAPAVRSGRRPRLSLIWLLPLLAALIGGSLLFRQWLSIGPTITISFLSADGLEVGQTKLRYKNVVVGTVSGISLSADRSHVLVQAELDRDASLYVAREGASFWVVRPQLGLSGVSGLGTLLSGAYIAVDADQTAESAPQQRRFTGLEHPPELISGVPGRRYTLRAGDLGSLNVGSPVYFRRIPVGRVIGYELNPNGKSVDVQIFIDAPHDRHVTRDSRFWNASGLNISLGADGFNVNTGTLASLVAGGIMFGHTHEDDGEPAAADSVFTLAPNQVAAMADPDGPPFVIELHFPQSVRGLNVGAPVDFRGLELGKVIDIDLEWDRKSRQFYALVKAELYPMRFGPVYETLVRERQALQYPASALLGPLVRHGLRGQLRASSLLTGQQYLALDFFPDEPAVIFDENRVPMILPTVPGTFDRLQQQLGSIVAKIDAVPFDGIAHDLRDSLQSLTSLLKRLDGQVAPEASAALKSARQSLDRVSGLLSQDAPLQGNLDRTLREFSEAARSLRALAERLQAQPTMLLRGNAADGLTVQP